jgi:hypothetical protein
MWKLTMASICLVFGFWSFYFYFFILCFILTYGRWLVLSIILEYRIGQSAEACITRLLKPREQHTEVAR